MLFELLKSALNSIFMVLHINQTTEFPKALSKDEEKYYLDQFINNNDIKHINSYLLKNSEWNWEYSIFKILNSI